MQVGVVDGPGKGCAESLMRGRRGEPPCKLRRNGEHPRSIGGVQEFEFGREAVTRVVGKLKQG